MESTSHPDANGPGDRLHAAWAAYPPVPDLSSLIDAGVRGDAAALSNLIRIDASHRAKHREPIRLEEYAEAIGPAAMTSSGVLGPGATLTRAVLGFARQSGGDTAEIRQRLGEAFAADIDAVFGVDVDDERIPPTDHQDVRAQREEGPNRPSAEHASADHAAEDAKSWAWRRKFSSGTVINERYRLVKRLDLGHDGRPRGAFGQVWAVQQLIELGSQGITPSAGESNDQVSKKQTTQRLAIKFIRRERADPAVLRRFVEIEPKALARLSHPYVARFHELGFADGDPYLVMEYVRGGPITEYADAKRLKLDDRIALMVKACDAVQHVHSNGLLHRDLKPGNLLVTEVEGEGRHESIPKLIDFGLAKSSTNDPIASQVHSEVFAGTKPYSSPEQVARYPHEALTHAVDVYGLSAVLFELLVGVTPMHHVLSDAKSSETEKDSRCATAPRPSPLQAFNWLPREQQEQIASARVTTVARMRRMLGGAVELLMAAALELEPQRRLQDVSHLREDLESFLKGEPFRHVKREPLHSRVNRRVRRNPLPYAAAATVFLTLIAGIAGTTWQWQRAEGATELARDNERDALRQRNNARDASAFIANILTTLKPGSQGGAATALRFIENAEARLAATPHLSRDPESHATIREAIGVALRNFDFDYLAIQHLESALTHRQSQVTAAPEALAELLESLAHAYESIGRYDIAEQRLVAAIEVWSRSDAAHKDSAILRLEQQRCIPLLFLGRLSESRNMLERVLRQQRSLLGEHHEEVRLTLAQFASWHEHRSDYESASRLYAEAITLQRATVERAESKSEMEKELVRLARWISGRSYQLVQRKEHSEAATLLSEAAEVLDAAEIPPLHPARLELRMWSLNAQRQRIDDELRDWEQPEKQEALQSIFRAFQSLLDDYSLSIGADSMATLIATGNFANIADDAYGPEVAIPVLEELLDRKRGLTSPVNRNTLVAVMNLARMHCERGDCEAGSRLSGDAYRRARSISLTHPLLPGLTSMYFQHRRNIVQDSTEGHRRIYEQELEAWDEQIDAWDAIGEPANDRLAIARRGLSRTLIELGDLATAKIHLIDALSQQRRSLGEDSGETESTRLLLANVLFRLREVE